MRPRGDAIPFRPHARMVKQCVCVAPRLSHRTPVPTRRCLLTAGVSSDRPVRTKMPAPRAGTLSLTLM